MLRRKKVDEEIDTAIANSTINKKIRQLTETLQAYKEQLEALQQSVNEIISQIESLKKLSNVSITAGQLFDIIEAIKQQYPHKQECIEFVESQLINLLAKIK